MQLEKSEIENLDRKYKLNLINSISGIKPANLIGTRSSDGRENVAIFSSVIHLGSNPAQLGFIMRPQIEAQSDTYLNINETGYYTINHVSEDFVQKAHYTSAKLGRDESEFERMKLQKEIIGDFQAPFVKESAVKIGMKHMQSIPLPNDCILIIGTVELLVFPDEAINKLGQMNLEAYDLVGISGLNTYYGLKKLDSFPYVRSHEIPDFE
jgi:flavin reductase (DIM6/NTAB) family NADH-FMN oxidoreductase RutF